MAAPADAAAATFYVCRSCVWSESARERDGKRQGTFLLEAVRDLIEAEPLPETLNLRAVYCLNGCKSPCNVGFRSAGKHHVRFSHLTPENAADVIAYARAYQVERDRRSLRGRHADGNARQDDGAHAADGLNSFLFPQALGARSARSCAPRAWARGAAAPSGRHGPARLMLPIPLILGHRP